MPRRHFFCDENSKAGFLLSSLGIGEMAKTRPGGFSLAVYSILGIYTSFFGYGLLYVPYVPYGV